MGMMGNFNQTLKLQNGGHEVMARGPLRWNEIPTAQRVRVIATITQEPTYGSGFRDFQRPANPDGTWWCVVPAEDGQVFHPGPALAAGVVVVLDPAGWDNPWPWPDRPVLTPQHP